MATSTRLKGSTGLFLTFKLGAGSAVSYADDVKKFELTYDDKDSDDLTFAEAAAGLGYNATLKLTGIVSYDAGSLFALLTDQVGQTYTIEVGPWGNATATATKPHFKGDASWSTPPPLSNEAALAKDAKGAEFEFEISFSTNITKVTS